MCPAAPRNHPHPPQLLVKLCDFGNSLRLKSPAKSVTLKKLSGTVAFMAPEMLKKNTVSAASDVYALAITIWQLLHRKQPYAQLHSEEQVIYGVVKNNLRPGDDDDQEDQNRDNSDTESNNRKAGHVIGGLKADVHHSRLHWFQRNSPEVHHHGHQLRNLPNTEGLTWKTQEEEEEQLDGEEASDINWNAVFSYKSSEAEEMALLNPCGFKEILGKYQELYEKCWSRKPRRRPTTRAVLKALTELLGSFI